MHMNWDFIAQTPEDLAKIGKVLLKARKQKYLDEQIQMTRLLETSAKAPFLHFPFCVRHAGENEVPDFQLLSGNCALAAELTKITVQDVEYARGLQRTKLKQTLTISNLYRKQLETRTRDEVIAEGFSMPQLVTPPTVNEHWQIWRDAFAVQLTKKTEVINGSQFNHGKENWLLLWDRIGTSNWKHKTKIRSLAKILAPFWSKDWYARVFLQAEDFSRTVMFTPKDQTIFESRVVW